MNTLFPTYPCAVALNVNLLSVVAPFWSTLLIYLFNETIKLTAVASSDNKK